MANHRIHRMSTDLETLLTLAAAGNLPATTDYLMSLPHDVRADAIKIVRSGIPKPQAINLRYDWPLYARGSQLPPEEDWDTWLILAGRGFGKTRTGAEWVRAQIQDGHAHRIALVARTLPEAQSIMIEGESGLLNICPPSNKPTYEPSKRKLTWPSGAFALAFSSHEPDQLRGPQFDAAWCDELASWEYPEQTWDNLNFALRLGRRPRSVVTTTPKPIELVRSLPQQTRRVRHPWLHLRKPGQPSPLILQGHHRPVRRHSNRQAGDLRRAYGRGRRRPLETRVDRESAHLKPPAHVTNRRRRRPRHVHQAPQAQRQASS